MKWKPLKLILKLSKERVVDLAKVENKTAEVEVKEKITFTKAKILQSKRYSHRVDLLGVLLTDSKAYTFDEVDALIDKFMKKGKVK